MKLKSAIGCAAAGLAAGAVTGLFGAGGGMVLVPLLRSWTDLEEDTVFPSSVCVILPICLVSLIGVGVTRGLPLTQALPYLLGSAIGGFLSVGLSKKIPTLWLHKLLGILILWGGFRYLC